MKGYSLRAFGITVSATFLATLSLAVFMLSLYMKISDYMKNNLNLFLIGSAIGVLLFLIIGAISISEVGKKIKL